MTSGRQLQNTVISVSVHTHTHTKHSKPTKRENHLILIEKNNQNYSKNARAVTNDENNKAYKLSKTDIINKQEV